jgi:IS30 family transposase
MNADQLRQWISDGCTIRECARRLDKHPYSVARFMRQHGIEANSYGPNDEQVADVLRLLRVGALSFRAIARSTEVSEFTVRRLAKKHGIKTTYVPVTLTHARNLGLVW